MSRKPVSSAFPSFTNGMAASRPLFWVSTFLVLVLCTTQAGTQDVSTTDRTSSVVPGGAVSPSSGLTLEPSQGELLFSEGETGVVVCRGDLNWTIHWTKERKNVTAKTSSLNRLGNLCVYICRLFEVLKNIILLYRSNCNNV